MSFASLLSDVEQFERSIVHWVTCEAHHPFLGRVFEAVQSEWIGFPLLLLGVFWISRRDGRVALRALGAAAASFGICMGLATILWATVDRERPPHHYERWLRTEAELATCAQAPDAFPVRSHVSARPSFPSRHALTIGSFAGALLLASTGVGVVAWAYGLFVAFGRIYVGKHWPTDLLAGLVLSMVVVWLCWRALPAVFSVFGIRHWFEDTADSTTPPREGDVRG